MNLAFDTAIQMIQISSIETELFHNSEVLII